MKEKTGTVAARKDKDVAGFTPLLGVTHSRFVIATSAKRTSIFRGNQNSVDPVTGFTLVELLVVIAVIAILMAMALPAFGRTKRLGARVVCMNNERAQVVGAHLYAGEASGKLSGLADPSDTDLNWLRPFVGGLDTLRHPVVRNVIRPDIVLPVQSEWYRERLLGMTEVMADLAWNTETRGGHGVGYVTLGFMWTGGWTHNQVRKTYGEFGQQLWLGILKTESNTAGWVHRNEALGLKGQTVGPDQIFHTVDVDLDMSGHRGYPDKGDPHGEANNVAFVDGHVELVSAKKWIKWSSDCPAVSEYLYRYERSGDANLSAPQPEDHSLIEWRHLWLKKL